MSVESVVWEPWCTRPSGLVAPSRIDPAGLTGPTPGQVRGPRWTTVAPRLFAPAERPGCVEQRILEQHARVRGTGAVTGWASLRWQGAHYFDGAVAGPQGLRVPQPVPLVVASATTLRAHPASSVSKAQLAPAEQREIDGVVVTSVQRALFDEIVRREQLWSAVRALDMTLAAGLISLLLFTDYVGHRSAWTGVPLVRTVLTLGSEHSRSPQETWLRLVWRLALGWSPPLVNQPVFGLDGQLVGIPDLLDPDAGLAAEYNGAYHESATQTRKDRDREAGFRDVGLEYVESVRGDAVGDAAARLHRARARAPHHAPSVRAWTLDPPSWWTRRETLDARLVRTSRVDDLSTF